MTGAITFTQSQKYLVLGDYQTGKSTWCWWLLSQMQRWAAWDPTHALPVQGAAHDLRTFQSHFAHYGRAVYQPLAVENEEALQAEFSAFCRYMMTQANALVFVDEPALVMSPTDIPAGFGALHRLGHKRGLGVALATHRIHGDLPPLVRIHHHFASFRMSVDNDIKVIAGMVGAEAAAAITKLPDYHWYYKGTHYRGQMPPIDISQIGGVRAPRNAAQAPRPEDGKDSQV